MNMNIWIFISFFFVINNCLAANNGGEENEVPLVFESRIIGGINSNSARRPFQVSIQHSSHFCGGSIISELYIVTAAHCLDGDTASKIRVIVGTTNLKEPARRYEASKIIMHENYAPADSHRNDIALIKLTRPIVFNNNIKPIRLPQSNEEVRTGVQAIVSGWGYRTISDPRVSNMLQEADVRITSPKYCKDVMAKRGDKIYPTQICAFNENQRKGHCKGDSGGPLTLNGKLIGIVSWSVKDPECASTTYPGVYTRVASYVKWIQRHKK